MILLDLIAYLVQNPVQLVCVVAVILCMWAVAGGTQGPPEMRM